MLLVGQGAPIHEIAGKAIGVGGDRFEQHDELVEMVEIIAREQRRFR